MRGEVETLLIRAIASDAVGDFHGAAAYIRALMQEGCSEERMSLLRLYHGVLENKMAAYDRMGALLGVPRELDQLELDALVPKLGAYNRLRGPVEAGRSVRFSGTTANIALKSGEGRECRLDGILEGGVRMDGSNCLLVHFNGVAHLAPEVGCDVDIAFGNTSVEGCVHGKVSLVEGRVCVSDARDNVIALGRDSRAKIHVTGMAQSEVEGTVVYHNPKLGPHELAETPSEGRLVVDVSQGEIRITASALAGPIPLRRWRSVDG